LRARGHFLVGDSMSARARPAQVLHHDVGQVRRVDLVSLSCEMLNFSRRWGSGSMMLQYPTQSEFGWIGSCSFRIACPLATPSSSRRNASPRYRPPAPTIRASSRPDVMVMSFTRTTFRPPTSIIAGLVRPA
jgi:hypothetical protein